jgi:hypothetical protein
MISVCTENHTKHIITKCSYWFLKQVAYIITTRLKRVNAIAILNKRFILLKACYHTLFYDPVFQWRSHFPNLCARHASKGTTFKNNFVKTSQIVQFDGVHIQHGYLTSLLFTCSLHSAVSVEHVMGTICLSVRLSVAYLTRDRAAIYQRSQNYSSCHITRERLN